MKKDVRIGIISFICGILFVAPFLYIMYQLGYCNACDKYIGASECKPKRKLDFTGK